MALSAQAKAILRHVSSIALETYSTLRDTCVHESSSIGKRRREAID